MIKNDQWIRKMVKKDKMIEPFESSQVRNGMISYGLSSYGYDARLSDEFQIASVSNQEVIDPKKIGHAIFEEVKAPEIVIPPSSYVLGRSLEYFRIPRKVLGLCVGKSTYARSGVLINVTPLEPEWEGYITIAISNITGKPVKLYGMEGIIQILFFESDEEPEISYKDRKGKYQAQQLITPSKI